ncbi:endogenous retrovirus group K member 19 Env polyprotein-like [Macaca thibetana thibetana]|uniref:endogenous retrovirus group K member 19 Env polyprotein-like n=1 Tax=Macaca thibetana thibetana TaxID=257877 RepID=UPI0021BC9ECA|nr:endogenous retrovirus group K member 19 Env polyprotein-like [Macaca thibetana thibetana]XP_050654896.1 endogenous retrovirus group K member 19 Env polyprotein-like [Macaca thibetana thibetana]
MPDNTMYHSDILPLCVSYKGSNPYCVPATQFWLHHGKRNALTVSAAGSLKPGNVISVAFPNIPSCAQEQSQESNGFHFSWEVCHGGQARSLQLGNGNILDWSPHSHLQGSLTDVHIHHGISHSFIALSHSPMIWANGGTGYSRPQVKSMPPQDTLSCLGHLSTSSDTWHGTYHNSSNNYTNTFIHNHTDQCLICITHPYVFLMGTNISTTPQNSAFVTQVQGQAWFASCITNYNISNSNITSVMVLRRQSEAFLSVNLTCDWQGSSALATLERTLSQVRPKRFIGTLIAFTVSAIVILATASVAVASITESVKMFL